jgi:8-oxo-dGTP pyrophosphatase MutT (NUDIX family)
MIERFQVVPAAYVVLRRGEQVLLQLRQNTGFMDDHWAVAAAGHVEAEESVFEAAVREAREELGITIDPADLVGLTGMHRTQRNGRPIDERVDWFFECRRWQGEPRLKEQDKAAALIWYPLDDLPDPVVPHERYVLEHLLAGTLQPVVTFGFDPAWPDPGRSPDSDVGHGTHGKLSRSPDSDVGHGTHPIHGEVGPNTGPTTTNTGRGPSTSDAPTVDRISAERRESQESDDDR